MLDRLLSSARRGNTTMQIRVRQDEKWEPLTAPSPRLGPAALPAERSTVTMLTAVHADPQPELQARPVADPEVPDGVQQRERHARNLPGVLQAVPHGQARDHHSAVRRQCRLGWSNPNSNEVVKQCRIGARGVRRSHFRFEHEQEQRQQQQQQQQQQQRQQRRQQQQQARAPRRKSLLPSSPAASPHRPGAAPREACPCLPRPDGPYRPLRRSLPSPPLQTNFALQLKGWRENMENFCGSKPPEGGCGSRQAQGFYPLWQPTASVFHGNRRFADCDPIAQFDRFDPRTTIGLPLEVRAVSRALDFLIPVSEALPQRGTRDSNPQPRVPTRSQNRKRPNAQSHRANGETNFALQLKGWRENMENFCGSKPPEGGCGSRQAQGFYPLWQPTASVFHGNRRFADCDPIAQFDRFDPRTTIGLPLEVRAVSRALDFLIPVSEALPQRGTRDSNPQPRVPTRSQNRKRPNAQSHRANGAALTAQLLQNRFAAEQHT
ncbi:Serine/threonine-protein kinase 10 [Frankliniella fusca]|uniref:Serine/threonine-protein kinase 10 n=1 Tax=Frankliniella fusca TaxID=407009 RepID=A0AAE1GZ49_9NEOP|nr:Serine/threonine-protein kinase 10 [Frankliniella fusca]